MRRNKPPQWQSRTSWSCGLICHVDCKVEGSNLAADTIFYIFPINKKSHRVIRAIAVAEEEETKRERETNSGELAQW